MNPAITSEKARHQKQSTQRRPRPSVRKPIRGGGVDDNENVFAVTIFLPTEGVTTFYFKFSEIGARLPSLRLSLSSDVVIWGARCSSQN